MHVLSNKGYVSVSFGQVVFVAMTGGILKLQQALEPSVSPEEDVKRNRYVLCLLLRGSVYYLRLAELLTIDNLYGLSVLI
jgi:hypothetical protein